MRCASTGDIFVSSRGALRLFTPPGYELAGKPAYANVTCTQIDACTVRGPPVATAADVADLITIGSLRVAASAPCGFGEGAVVRCDADGSIYIQQDGKLRQFTGPGYTAAGTPAYVSVDCGRIETCARGTYVDAVDVPGLRRGGGTAAPGAMPDFCAQGAWGDTSDAVYQCQTADGRFGRWGWEGQQAGQCCSCDMKACSPGAAAGTPKPAAQACSPSQCLIDGRCYDDWASAPSNFHQCRARGTNKYGRWGWGENEGKCCNCDFSECAEPHPAS